MKLFSRNKSQQNYKVIKLYIVADSTTAMELRTKECLEVGTRYLIGCAGAEPTRFSLNYGTKQWKTLSKFQTELAKLSVNNIVNAAIGYDHELSSLVFHNTMLNLTRKPQLAPIEFQLAVRGEKCDEESNQNFVSDFYNIFKFDYGYIVDLGENYDFPTERKVKTGLFSQTVTVDESDRTWRFHIAGVSHGFLKKLYQSNYINQSHLENPVISSLIERGVGKTKKVNENITLWQLDLKDFDEAKAELNNSAYMIVNEHNANLFSSSDEAKRFYSEMEI